MWKELNLYLEQQHEELSTYLDRLLVERKGTIFDMIARARRDVEVRGFQIGRQSEAYHCAATPAEDAGEAVDSEHDDDVHYPSEDGIPDQGKSDGITVCVTIVSARGLRNADWIGKSDPFCTCEVKGKADVMIQTPIVDGDVNPFWNYKQELVGYRIEDDLEFIVKDKDLAKSDDILGRVTLPSERFYPDGIFEGDLVLEETETEPKASLTLRIVVGDEQTPKEEIIDPPIVSPEDEIIHEDDVKKPSSIFCCAA